MVVTRQTIRRNSLSYSILTSFDRGAIEKLVNLGYSLQKIADTMGFSKSTIHYELQRVKPYQAQLAEQDAATKRQRCGRKSLLTAGNKQVIENHLRLTWSPEAIAHELHLTTATLCNWLNQGRLNFSLENLPNRNVFQHRKNETRGTFQVDQSIEERPKNINDRTCFGHWEVDTILSSRGKDKACLVTFIERQTRLLWAIPAPNRTKEAMTEVFKHFTKRFGSTVKSITVDHGKEFSGYRELQKRHDISVYFCHAYSPWERGTNELFNRKLRWFFPKKTLFSQIDDQQIYEALELINKRPMKLHDYRTPLAIFRDRSN